MTTFELTDGQKQLAAALLEAKPANLFTNPAARSQWYSLCTAAAESHFRTGSVNRDRILAGMFFDLCQVPT